MMFNYKHTKKKEKKNNNSQKGTNKEDTPNKMTREVWHAPNIPQKRKKKKLKSSPPSPPPHLIPSSKGKKNGPLGCMLLHFIG
jgi:hypothetical protein